MTVTTTREAPIAPGRVQRFLEQYSCGPDGHELQGDGVGAADGLAATLPLLGVCTRCAKLVGREICVICGQFGRFHDGLVPATRIRHHDGREIEGALCAPCYLDLREGTALGWSVA